MLEEYPNLSTYVERGEDRPAYKRACDAQLAVFTGIPPAAEEGRSKCLSRNILNRMSRL